jgi:hypothetical protein
MKEYQKINNILGWATFIVASMIYILTCEPTASFWDCGEYISTAYKFQVGHPPGAPFFQLLGRFFSLFAFGDVTKVALMVNIMSAIVSGASILFLFWSITALAKKVILRGGEMTDAKMYAIFGSGLVGAFAYAFSDSFWFSAVEGEVYATSSFFTAIVFWAILKWETVAEEKFNLKWIIFIAFLMGLSIGVHLLNLLAIPAIVFVYYFKNYKNTKPTKLLLISILSIIILAVIMFIIIPWTVKMAGLFEMFFVNSLGMPFNSGTIFYFFILIGAIVWGIMYSHKKKKVILNTAILCFTFILIGYSSFFMLVIRSNANPPIDENNPENAISLLSYLNREQYGDWPLLYGQYYNAPVDAEKPYLDGNPVYAKDEAKGKYVIIDHRKASIPNYDDRFCTIFPRMYDSDNGLGHIDGYKSWANFKEEDGTPISVNEGGKSEVIYKPSFTSNLKFFFNYQIGHMYLRYFMWNFVGRQSDIENTDGNIIDGNWISGIPFIDEARLGPQKGIPDNMKNKANNKFYFFPLILGLLGFFYHLRKHPKDTIVVGWLFVMTGLAIVIYLNQYSNQPRERDYAFAASFYAFAIWIGLGVLAIFDFLSKKVKPNLAAILTTGACFLLVPTIMGKEGWNDHNRSGRYTARDFAMNYLNSCAPNAILFTNGDNDTFPLWYCQEVEGIRTDVRVVNLSLLNTDWYIDQMARKAYKSDAVPFTLKNIQYRQGTRDYAVFYEDTSIVPKDKFESVKSLMEFVGSDDPNSKLQGMREAALPYFPTRNFSIPVDKKLVIANGTVPANKVDSILPSVDWTIKNVNMLQKNHLMVVDLLAAFDWKRPIYFAITTGGSNYIGLDNYFQLEGLAYRLVPFRSNSNDGQTGYVNTDIMYDNLMNKFKWGNIQDPNVYLDETNMRMTWSFRLNFARLAGALITEGKKDKAIKVLDRCMEVMPEKTIPFSNPYLGVFLVEQYYRAGANDKGNKLMEHLFEITNQQLKYFYSFTGTKASKVDSDRKQAIGIMQKISQLAQTYKQEAMAKKSKDIFDNYYKKYVGAGGDVNQQ